MFEFFQSQAFYIVLYGVLMGGMTYGLIRFCVKAL